ncbi:hypothetical protein DPEC_G00227160 [Dallia pectoralis]|uniref:Uncharacterized protein n=1 Tax=Dallia pectoralis TaxID=75939 RepID=A0ACC2G181_DALPE|nr:hypothetical protein DPEC_G00227160 [Dallia pectoralis]
MKTVYSRQRRETSRVFCGHARLTEGAAEWLRWKAASPWGLPGCLPVASSTPTPHHPVTRRVPEVSQHGGTPGVNQS